MTAFSTKRRTSSYQRRCDWLETAPVELGGLSFHMHPSGALYCPEHDAVIVADLHLEKGSSRASRGVHLPPFDTRSTLLQLKAILEECEPSRLMFLGDSFHDDEADARLDETDRKLLSDIASRYGVTWIAGNHDPLPPRGLRGDFTASLKLGNVVLRHEPDTGAGFEIAGHLHPAAVVTRRGRRIRRKCFIGNDRRMILPAMGAYTGALNVWSPAFRKLFPDGAFDVWIATSVGQVVRINARNLGRSEQD